MAGILEYLLFLPQSTLKGLSCLKENYDGMLWDLHDVESFEIDKTYKKANRDITTFVICLGALGLFLYYVDLSSIVNAALLCPKNFYV